MIELLAAASLFIGLANCLPLLMLDGGQIPLPPPRGMVPVDKEERAGPIPDQLLYAGAPHRWSDAVLPGPGNQDDVSYPVDGGLRPLSRHQIDTGFLAQDEKIGRYT